MSLDLQIGTEVRGSDHETWATYAFVTSAKSRRGKTGALDEYGMIAVAHAIAARFEAARATTPLITSWSPSVHYSHRSPYANFSTPSVGLNNAGTKAYVKIENTSGTKVQAEAALALVDQAVKAFKLSDIGLS